MDFFAISSFALIEKIVSKEKYFPPFFLGGARQSRDSWSMVDNIHFRALVCRMVWSPFSTIIFWKLSERTSIILFNAGKLNKIQKETHPYFFSEGFQKVMLEKGLRYLLERYYPDKSDMSKNC